MFWAPIYSANFCWIYDSPSIILPFPWRSLRFQRSLLEGMLKKLHLPIPNYKTYMAEAKLVAKVTFYPSTHCLGLAYAVYYCMDILEDLNNDVEMQAMKDMEQTE